jgi:hypothetical protein
MNFMTDFLLIPFTPFVTIVVCYVSLIICFNLMSTASLNFYFYLNSFFQATAGQLFFCAFTFLPSLVPCLPNSKLLLLLCRGCSLLIYLLLLQSRYFHIDSKHLAEEHFQKFHLFLSVLSFFPMFITRFLYNTKYLDQPLKKIKNTVQKVRQSSGV